MVQDGPEGMDGLDLCSGGGRRRAGDGGGAARECGLSDEAMRRQLNGTRPLYFDSVLGVMRALGIQLRVEASA